MPLPLSAAILGGSALSGGLQMLGQHFGNKSTNTANMQLAKYQYKKDLEQWNRQNEYNSPLQQMERYKAAGLNPNLIYGSGSASAGNAASPVHFNAPTVDKHVDVPNLFSGALNAYQAFLQNQAQLDLTKANIANVQQETANKAVYNIGMKLGNVPKQALASWIEKYPQLEEERLGIERYHLPFIGNSTANIQNRLAKEQVRNAMAQRSLIETQTEVARQEATFKRYENEFRKMGVTSSDNIVVRMMSRMLSSLDLNPSDLKNNLKSISSYYKTR